MQKSYCKIVFHVLLTVDVDLVMLEESKQARGQTT